MNQTLTSVAAIIILSAQPGSAAEAPATQEAKLLASDAGVNDQFGFATSIDGDSLVIGARFDDDIGDDSGSVYVFLNNGTSWNEQQRLIASDAEAFAEFGAAVSVSGDTLIVGAPRTNANSGSGYVFVWDGINWIQHHKLVTSDGTSTNSLGFSVSISGETLAIGASEAVYIFVKDGPKWVEQQKLIAGDGTGNGFGLSVWINGDDIVVGAANDSNAGNQAGAAYVFVRSGATWSQQQKLIAGDAAENDLFGRAVSISGDTIVVGAWRDDDLGVDSGSAYVFLRNGTTWSQQQKLTASDGAAADWFGESVALHEERIVIGAPRHDNPGTDSGAAYLFTRVGENWLEQKLTASDAAAFDSFGDSVAVRGEFAVVGAVADSDNGVSFAGSAYVYEFTPALPTATILGPVVPSTYGHGDSEVIEWTTTGIDPTELMALAMKRDIVPTSQTEPDGVNWIRFTEATPNDGEEIVTIPATAAIATDWRFYVRHASSGVFDATDFTFSVTDTSAPEADLSVSLSDDPDPVTVGENLTYSVTVENLGPDDASGVSLTDTILGSATTFVSTNQPTVCSESNGVVTCAIGDLTSGSTFPVIDIVVSADEAGTVSSAVDVSGTEPDPDPINNTAQEDTQVVGPASADLSVSLTDDNDPVLSGSHLTYTITVTNTGPDTAESVSVDALDDPPGEFNPLSGAAGTGTVGCAEDPFAFPVCSLGDIEPGGSRSYTLAGTVRLDSGTLSLEVEVMSSTLDPDTTNNVAIESTTVEFLAVEVVDVNPDFLTSAGTVTTNPEILSFDGTSRLGAAADGVTRLLLRVELPGPGTVVFSLDGGSAPMDGGLDVVGGDGRFASVESPVNNTSNGFKAFAVYRVPEEFNRGSDDDAADRFVAVTAEYIPPGRADGTRVQQSLKLVRPPLVMIHGLWSDPLTWTLPLATDTRFPHVEFADYELLASFHFITNAGAAFAATYNALTEVRQQGIATTQVDVIGHSMGGILARKWTNALPYRGKRNLNTGDFRKIITFDTPHMGSPAASILNVFRTDPLYGIFVRNKMRVAGYPIDDGAIEDLSLGSNAITAMQASSVPAHAIVGRIDTTGLPDLPEALGVSYTVLQFLGVVLDELFDDFHDGLVSQASQEGGIQTPSVSYFSESEGGMHLHNTSSAFYSNAVRVLLDTPVTSSAFGQFPDPSGLPFHPPSIGLGEYSTRIQGASLEITQPAPGSVFEPGEFVQVVVEATGGILVDKVLIVSPSSAEIDNSSPFEFLLQIPAESLGAFTIAAAGLNLDTGELFNADDVSVSVQTSSQLLSLDARPDNLILFGTGYSRQIRALGTFDDGITRDISDPALGTIYSVADPQVATVSLQGLVTAIEEGSTVVTIENGTAQDEVIVEVAPGLPVIFFDDFESGSTSAWSTTNSG